MKLLHHRQCAIYSLRVDELIDEALRQPIGWSIDCFGILACYRPTYIEICNPQRGYYSAKISGILFICT